MTRGRLAATIAGGAVLVAAVAVALVVAARRDEPAALAPASTSSSVETSSAGTTAPVATTSTTVMESTTSATATKTSTSVESSTTTTTAPASTTPPITTAAVTTATGAASPPTTLDPEAKPAFACEAAALLRAYAASQPLPSGASLRDHHCYGIFAGAVLTAPGRGEAFALFGPGEGAWQLLNAGSAFVCQPFEIPDPAYTTIGCPAWDQ